jgi:predicted RNase H-like nuclease
MDVIGIDLSGPCNAADTAVAAFRSNGRSLVLQERLLGADDAAIAALIARARPDADLVVGLDAPLSYNDGGGDRPADRLLRARAIAAGLPPRVGHAADAHKDGLPDAAWDHCRPDRGDDE